jgi:hypothetical protein
MSKKRKSRYRVEKGKVCIELKVRNIKQLFDARDPAPFRERDLDDDAVSYVVSAFREFQLRTPIKVKIHLSEDQANAEQEQYVREAVASFFEYEALLARRKLSQTLRQGQLSLIIGITFMSLCLGVSYWLDTFDQKFLSKLGESGLLVFGWVAMWRPIDIFLYGWWPELELVKIYEKLTRTEVELVYNGSPFVPELGDVSEAVSS